jgi:large conductance mechanosensitive channel
MTMLKEFMGFIKQYGVIGLAIAVIIGGKLNELVTAIVNGLLMPIIGLLPVGGDWKTWEVMVGEQHFLIGPILNALINFLIVALLVFWFAKKVLREETVSKK